MSEPVWSEEESVFSPIAAAYAAAAPRINQTVAPVLNPPRPLGSPVPALALLPTPSRKRDSDRSGAPAIQLGQRGGPLLFRAPATRSPCLFRPGFSLLESSALLQEPPIPRCEPIGSLGQSANASPQLLLGTRPRTLIEDKTALTPYPIGENYLPLLHIDRFTVIGASSRRLRCSRKTHLPNGHPAADPPQLRRSATSLTHPAHRV